MVRHFFEIASLKSLNK
uniref:Uncharacterized protein n=1 Tax=Anguilla anguilla TaxID=7936 RepID=A0A0E9T092_ANGAN